MLFKKKNSAVNLSVKHLGRGWNHGIERFYVDLVKSGNTAEERSLVFTEFTYLEVLVKAHLWAGENVRGQAWLQGLSEMYRNFTVESSTFSSAVILPPTPGPLCIFRIPIISLEVLCGPGEI